jgi:hypothetical protein
LHRFRIEEFGAGIKESGLITPVTNPHTMELR